MLSINNSPATPWPVPTGQAVKPVQPITPAGAAQRSANESRQQNADGRGTGAQAPSVRLSQTVTAETRPQPRSESPAAPLLPRERPPEEQQAADPAEAAGADEARAQEEAEQALEAARRPQPQQVLSSVWKASGAVIDQALGDVQAPTSVEAAGAAQAVESPGMVVVATAGRLLTAAESEADRAGVPVPVPVAAEAQEVVAYDERGNGTPAPVELGAIISERV